MNYLLALLLALSGVAILIFNKSFSIRFGRFTADRHGKTFGPLARYLGWDNADSPFNRFLHRFLVIFFGVFLLVMAVHAAVGTIYIGAAQAA